MDVVEDLVEQGWVASVDPLPGGMGRPARRYRFRADAGYVLGLDVGHHKVLAVVTDLDGGVMGHAREQVPGGRPDDSGPDDHLAAMDRAVAACLESAGLPADRIWAATVGSTGVVDRQGRVVHSATIPGWADVDLAGHLRQIVGCPVFVENDSKLAALAEQRRGVARAAKDVVFLHVGRSTGVGLIIDGRLHHGHSGATGEIGMLRAIGWGDAVPELERCSVVSAATPAAQAGKIVFDAAREGDPDAVAAVGRYAGVLALGTAAIVLTLDPELIVLGGGFSRAGDVLLDPLREALRPLCLRLPEVRLSALGEECVAIGAGCLARDHLDQRLFSPDRA